MKRKLFILGTLGLAGLFAGGVVAAYTITDLADKQGIKITPGTIHDDEVGSVTLEWGDMTSFTKVEGLNATTPVTRTVNIKATTKDEDGVVQADEVYLGKLDVELKDLSGKASNVARLIDYLHVDINGYTYTVADGFASQKSKLGEIPTEGEGAFATSLGIYTNSTGKPVDFVISLDAKATPVMSQIMTDQVYLTVDWNRADGEDTGLKHVYVPSNGWDAMYVYAYSEDGGQNTDWPGVQLNKESESGLYEGYLSEHDFYIFNDGGSNQYPEANKDGITKSAINYADPDAIYFDWSTHAFTSTAPVIADADFYLVGDTTGWGPQAELGFVDASEAMTPEQQAVLSKQYSLTADVVAGKEYKIMGEPWAGYSNIEAGAQQGESRDLVTGADGDNFKFNASGNYTIYLKVWKSDSGVSLYIVKNA